MVEAVIKFDGGARPNPGPSAIGYIVETDEWTESGSEYIGESTNNKAEYHALIKGLETALDNSSTNVLAKGDSQLVMKQVCNDWDVNEESLHPLYTRAQELVDEFEQFDIERIDRDQNQAAHGLVDKAFSDQN